MKKLIVLLVLLLFAMPVSAERLVCDIPTDPPNIAACEVNIDGQVVPGVMDAGPVIRIYTDSTGSYMVLLDEVTMASLEAGRHIFIARIQDPSGWWSDWSGPLDAGKPGTLGNVKVAP